MEKLHLTSQDWQDIVNVPGVLKTWELDDNLTLKEISDYFTAFKVELHELGADRELYFVHQQYDSEGVEIFYREWDELRLLA